MRHARDDALDQLEPLLVELRRLPALREKSRGVFYRGSQAFLHFHEDPAGLFADVKVGGTFQRFAVNTKAERAAILRAAAAQA
jgi:hypothetical protein